PLRARKFQFLRREISRFEAAAAPVEALRAARKSKSGRGAGASLRREVFSARGQSSCARNGGEFDRRVEERPSGTELDGAGHEKGSSGKAGCIPNQNRVHR